ncbi:putative hydroxyindole O-methyltransferase, partial [Teratosphaeria nubilosa]
GQSVLSPILVVAVQLELFQKLRDAGEAGIATDDLCLNSPYHKHQVERILRHLKATNVIDTTGRGVWRSTALSNGLAKPHFQNSILFCHYISRQAFNGYPEYFSRLSQEEPSQVPGPFQIGLQTDLPFFDYLGTHPPNGSYFNHFMKAYREGNTMWFEPELYPVAERLEQDFDPGANEAFLVDIGGGKGHDISAFAAAQPDHPGKLILQDQASVIAEVPGQTHPFTLQPHDFFTPQPIKHARTYFLHSILHDWGDEDCLRILENLVPALKSGYSKVLFNEIVLVEEAPSIKATVMDMMMLGHCNPAYERTEAAWRGLLERGGLKIVRIFSAPGAAESVIEAKVA